MKNKKVDIKLFVECPKGVEDVCFSDCCECKHHVHYVNIDKDSGWVECSYEQGMEWRPCDTYEVCVFKPKTVDKT
jgi:hypothetical protein